MKKEIRKAILEAKERKETLLIEQEIIKNRIMFIVEDINNVKYFKKLPKSKKEKIAFSLFREFAYIQNNSLISESFDFMSILQGLFGSLFGRSAIETIAEPLVNRLLTAVGFKSESLLKKSIVSLLTTNPQKLIEAFQDCNKMTKLLMESFVEGMVMKLQDETEKGSMLFDYIRNVLGGNLSESSFINDLESKVSGPVCSLFDKFSGNAQDIVTKLKGATTNQGS